MKERKGEVIRDAFGQQKDIDVQRLGFRRVTSELAHVPKLISITVAHQQNSRSRYHIGFNDPGTGVLCTPG